MGGAYDVVWCGVVCRVVVCDAWCHQSLSSADEPKRRFVPSKWEAKKVVKLVNAIRNGWIRDPADKAREREAALRKEAEAYNLWGAESDQQRSKRLPPAIPTPLVWK